MSAIVLTSECRYPAWMSSKRPPTGFKDSPEISGINAPRPNRIAELTKSQKLNYLKVGEKAGVHEVTIANLARGKSKLTQEWMEKLADIFGVSPAEIAWDPPARGLRRIRVKGALQASAWSENHEWEEDQQYDVMIPDDDELRGLKLYAAEIRGDSMNLRYPAGTVVIISDIKRGFDKVSEGQRYHVRHTRADGMVEETIKTLVADPEGRYWLKPESSNPEFQAWLAIDGQNGEDGEMIEIVGRVRYVVQREV